ncbi:MAG TPA: ECF-type sigma factor [Phycisphaerae bacterium]|nr:sigma-70 family RNA polymerase sigma factor [Phycisphaerales bacterium]HNO77008.1 ECF-type sigma factor [Phycisphaerae bacterium]
MNDRNDAHTILEELTAGDQRAADRLMPLVYDELRMLAARHLRREPVNHTLQPTAIANEAYLRMVDQTRVDWKDRAHFLAVAATAVRRVLIDHARKRNSAKRGNDWQRVTLGGINAAEGAAHLDLLALDDALTSLEKLNERQCRVVQLRFFGGLTNEEIAHVLGVSRSTVVDDWTIAKAWLLSELSTDEQ